MKGTAERKAENHGDKTVIRRGKVLSWPKAITAREMESTTHNYNMKSKEVRVPGLVAFYSIPSRLMCPLVM